jgi:hypothetical protein
VLFFTNKELLQAKHKGPSLRSLIQEVQFPMPEEHEMHDSLSLLKKNPAEQTVHNPFESHAWHCETFCEQVTQLLLTRYKLTEHILQTNVDPFESKLQLEQPVITSLQRPHCNPLLFLNVPAAHTSQVLSVELQLMQEAIN